MVPAGVAWFFRPTPLVRLLCGSTSTRSTRRPATASEAARLMVVVVLPTPPFWLATATTRVIFGLIANMWWCQVMIGGFEDTRLPDRRQRLCSTWNTRRYLHRNARGVSVSWTVETR